MKRLFGSLGWLAVLLPFMCMGIAHATLLNKLDEESRDVRDFNSIQNNGSFHVFVKMGNTESLKLEGDPEILQNVETVVEQGTLKIRMKKNLNWFSMNKGHVSVYITAKRLVGLSQSGSGKIEIANPINSPSLDMKVSGSGNISCTAKVDDFSANISGSGQIDIEGSTDSNDIRISGSGKFNGAKLTANSTNVNISGSGDAYVFTNQELNAKISGSGSVHYGGSVKSVNASTSGSGKVRRL
ncbi:head GIN domain-containing protein [Olivibacter sp. CPCC 100613]|uniref:head GIN domain-containing protein n=1 Tax=Olivibacter sp. CPCC 100613 TaxID=3079931 RepID=UPI002FFC7D2A